MESYFYYLIYMQSFFHKHHQGGLSEGYKKYIAEKERQEDTYTEDGLALFRVQGTGPENMQSIQVEPVSSLLRFSSFPLINSTISGRILSHHSALHRLDVAEFFSMLIVFFLFLS